MLRPAAWWILTTTQHVIDALQLVVDVSTVALAAGEPTQ